MEPITTPSPQRDPEFAAARLEPVMTGSGELPPESYLRIVANPFLGFVGFLVWLMVVLHFGTLLRRRVELYAPITPIIALVLLASLALPPMFMQYHCLDCGATGRLSRWRRHTCAPSSLRRMTGQLRNFRGPAPFIQTILWLWSLLFLSMLGDALGVPWLQG